MDKTATQRKRVCLVYIHGVCPTYAAQAGKFAILDQYYVARPLSAAEDALIAVMKVRVPYRHARPLMADARAIFSRIFHAGKFYVFDNGVIAFKYPDCLALADCVFNVSTPANPTNC